MSKSLSRPGPSRRPRAKARAPGKIAPTKDLTSPPVRARKTVGEPIAKGEASALAAAPGESAAAGMVVELPARPRKSPRPRKYKPPSAPRFRIFIIASGWNTVARRVLRHNFALIRRSHKEDLVHLLSRKKSAELIRRHRSLIGRDPIIAVHDLEAMDGPGIARFHGFHLHLGILRTPRQALMALQTFAQFVGTHRRSHNLEAEIRSELRRESMLGMIEILLQRMPRALGG